MGKIISTYLCPHPPIIISEIGKGKEHESQNTIESLRRVAEFIKEERPDTIIVITPHGPIFRDAIAIGYNKILKGNLSSFGCPQIKISKENNIRLVDNIVWRSISEEIYCVKLNDSEARGYGVATDLDHGVQVPLYFIDKEYKDYNLIHITYGMLYSEELYKFGRIIQEVVEETEERVIVVASGDLSHKLKEDGPYGYTLEGTEFDSKIVNLIEDQNYEELLFMDKNLSENAGECGLKSLQIMVGCLDGYKVESDLLSYEGPFGVGYAVAKFDIKEKDEERKLIDKIYERTNDNIKNIREKEDPYVKLARKTLETYIKEGETIDIPSDAPKELRNNQAGVFVSIKKDGDLRGCIGTISPTKENIGREIINNAISAGTRDPRFHPIKKKELDKLVYSVDVLGQPEDINGLEDLDVKRYGVIVSSNGKRGLLLPNLEGVNTIDQQINIALQKANISKNEDYTIERFEVIRHK